MHRISDRRLFTGLQADIGSMESSISTMTETHREQCQKIDKLSKRFAWAAGAVITALAIGGYFVDKMWDVARPLIKQEVVKVAGDNNNGNSESQKPVIKPQ